MLMPSERFNRSGVILGPCRGCSVWTLEYDDEVVSTYPLPEFHALLESLLQEHLAECRGLQSLLE